MIHTNRAILRTFWGMKQDVEYRIDASVIQAVQVEYTKRGYGTVPEVRLVRKNTGFWVNNRLVWDFNKPQDSALTLSFSFTFTFTLTFAFTLAFAFAFAHGLIHRADGKTPYPDPARMDQLRAFLDLEGDYLGFWAGGATGVSGYVEKDNTFSLQLSGLPEDVAAQVLAIVKPHIR